jgi:hypothetical protein
MNVAIDYMGFLVDIMKRDFCKIQLSLKMVVYKEDVEKKGASIHNHELPPRSFQDGR